MRHSYDQSEYTRPGEEYTLPPEQSATLSGGRRLADRFGTQKRSLAEPDEAERQAAEVLAEEGPAGEAAGEELTTSEASSASADAKQTAERKEKRKRSLLLQFAAVASSVVLVTNSFGIDILGMDGLFNDSVILGELSTEPDDGASGHYDDEFDLIYGDLIPFGGDRTFPKIDNRSTLTVTQARTVDANNKYIAAVDFTSGSMGEQAMVEGFVWYGRKEPKFYTGPIPMSIPENPVSAESSSIYYDFDTNTLTLNNYHGKGLMINNMGQDFTIRLEGDSVLSEYLMVACGSVTITGEGGITINENDHYAYGIHVVGQWTKAFLMLDENIKFDISGSSSIFRITSTLSEKPVWYKSYSVWNEVYQAPLKEEDRSIIREDPETYHSWLMVGAQTHSTIVHVNNSYRPDGGNQSVPGGTDTEPSAEAPVVTVRHPIGGDSAFPILPNPMPDSVGADGIVHASRILAWWKNSQTGLAESLDVYSNQQNHPTGRDDISYDPASNTLTLNNYSGGWIDIRSMGSSFKIRLVGKNKLDGGISILGDLTSGSVTFTGDGYLSLNRENLSFHGISLDAGNAQACLMIDSSVSMDVYGGAGAISIVNTSAEKGIYFRSDRLPGLVQNRDGGESAPSVPGTFYDWEVLDESGHFVSQIHFGGEVPPETEPPADLPGLPVGGDASYPNLPNLEPGGTSPDGVRRDPQILLQSWDGTQDVYETFYLPDQGVGPMNTNSISYDPASNTLTLNNYHAYGLQLDNLGNGFKVRLVGKNVLENGIHIQGNYLGASIRFTGDGYLSLGASSNFTGLRVRGIYSETCVMIDRTVTMDLFGGEYAFWVEDTSAPKGVYYESDDPIDGVRQVIRTTQEDSSGTVSGSYNDWISVDANGDPVKHIHIGGEVPEDPELPGLPVGGDSSFPVLGNPNPNTPVPTYGILDEDYIRVFDRETNRLENIYVNRNQTQSVITEPGLSYNQRTNTLTLNNYHGAGISANMMGNSFTVKLIGENVLTQDLIVWGFYTAGSIRFTGNGSLSINSSLAAPVGLNLECEFSESCIMIEEGVTLDIYGATYALLVNATEADKGVYLLSSDPIPGIRQAVMQEIDPDVDFVSQRKHFVWTLLRSDTGEPAIYCHIKGSRNSR